MADFDDDVYEVPFIVIPSDSDMETETEEVPETPTQESLPRIPDAPDRLRMFSRKFLLYFFLYFC